MPALASARCTTLLLAVASALVLATALVVVAQSGAPKVRFDKQGALVRPDPLVYREWVFVGTPVTPNDLNAGKAAFPEFHNVYIDPESYQVYRRTGKFRDGTTLVKELVSVGSKKASSGNGYFMGEYIGLEVAMKDAKRFAKEPGAWAYFSFTNPGGPLKDKAQPFPAQACNTACHQPLAQQDWVFTQYYPVLRAAKP